MAGKKPTSSCPNWQILLGEYALGTIGERDRARLEVHLASCPACRRALAATEKLYEFMAGYELAQASPSLATKVADALRREMPARAPVAAPIPRPAAEPVAAPTPEYEPRRAGKPWWRVPAFVTALGTAAAAATVAVLYFKVWAPGQEPGTEEALSGRYPEALAAKSAAPPSAAASHP